jgi:hypothetical protein
MISVLFWDITQRRMLMLYRRFGQPIRPIFKGQEELDFLSLEDGSDRLSLNVGKALPLDAALFHKSTDLINNAAEA